LSIFFLFSQLTLPLTLYQRERELFSNLPGAFYDTPQVTAVW